MQFFLIGYMIISLCEIFTIGGFPLDGAVRRGFVAVHIASIVATTWILMMNGAVGYQLIDDGTALSLALIFGSAAALFVGTGYIALDTGFTFTRYWRDSLVEPNRAYALFTLYQIVPLFFLVVFFLLETFLVLRVLGETRPMREWHPFCLRLVSLLTSHSIPDSRSAAVRHWPNIPIRRFQSTKPLPNAWYPQSRFAVLQDRESTCCGCTAFLFCPTHQLTLFAVHMQRHERRDQRRHVLHLLHPAIRRHSLVLLVVDHRGRLADASRRRQHVYLASEYCRFRSAANTTTKTFRVESQESQAGRRLGSTYRWRQRADKAAPCPHGQGVLAAVMHGLYTQAASL